MSLIKLIVLMELSLWPTRSQTSEVIMSWVGGEGSGSQPQPCVPPGNGHWLLMGGTGIIFLNDHSVNANEPWHGRATPHMTGLFKPQRHQQQTARTKRPFGCLNLDCWIEKGHFWNSVSNEKHRERMTVLQTCLSWAKSWQIFTNS